MGHSVEYALNRANKALKKGLPSEAEKIFKSVLEVYPQNLRAKEGLKKVVTRLSSIPKPKHTTPDLSALKRFYSNESYDEAITEARRLLSENPDDMNVWNLLGAAFGKKGWMDDAIQCFEKVRIHSPRKASANNNLGSVFREKGEYHKAIMYYEEALAENPEFFDAQKNLAATYHQLDQNERALTEFKKALKIKPDDIEVYNASASILNKIGKPEEALKIYEKILILDPQYKQVWNNKGNILLAQKETEKAIACYEKALEIDPVYSDALNNLGNALRDLDYLDESIHYYREALKAPKARTELWSNLGVALKDRGYYEESLEAFDTAISHQPEYPDAEWNKALSYLSMGNFVEGWKSYEWRWKATNFDTAYIQSSKPQWSGKKERVLIWPEQGIGDQVMFSKLFQSFASLCELAIFQVDSRLLPVLRRTYPEFLFIPAGKKLAENEYDSHLPMGSIPLHLNLDKEKLKNLPHRLFEPDKVQADKIKQAFRLGDKKLVGISWRSANSDSGKRRSIDLAELCEHLKHTGYDIVSLQYGDTKQEIESAYQKTGVPVLSVNEIDTFSNIEGLTNLISICDHIVTIDNSTVHIAGSLGKNTDLLLPANSDWRWRYSNNDTVWYDKVNVFTNEFGKPLNSILPLHNLNSEIFT